jgi:ankyrin repeat protein
MPVVVERFELTRKGRWQRPWRALLLAAVLALILLGLAGLYVTRPNSRRATFENAIDKGDVATAAAMLARGEPVDGYPKEDEYMSPLEQAAWGGGDAIVDLLLKHGAEIQVDGGWGALAVAASEGHLSTVELLIKRGVLKQDRQAKLDYALWGSAVEGKTEVVRFLLHQGADPSVSYPGSGTLLEACTMLGQQAVIDILKAAGAKK